MERLQGMDLIDRILACFDPPDPAGLDRLTSNDRVGLIFRSAATAFPDARLEVAWTVADPERIVIAGVLHATHLGPWRGVERTGRAVSALMVLGFAVDHDRIADVTVVVDSLSVAEQIGAIDPLDPPVCRLANRARSSA